MLAAMPCPVPGSPRHEPCAREERDGPPSEIRELIDNIESTNRNGDISIPDFKAIPIINQLKSQATVYRSQRSNQYVEHIKYQGDEYSDESDSDSSWDEYCNNNIGNKLYCMCKKCYSCNRCNRTSTTYKKDDTSLTNNSSHDPVRLNFTSSNSHHNNLIQPVSFLDLFCQRLEDSYDLDMENIIIYVNNIIEQLKKISSGEYLTSAAKEKWIGMEFPSEFRTTMNENNTKIIETSACVPLRLEKKCSGLSPTWEDIVQSDLDIRSLSKMFERKIIIEVPKMLSGTYELFNESSGNNVTISCKQNNDDADTVPPNLNLTFQIKPSVSGHFLSNIDTVMMVEENETTVPSSIPKTVLSLLTKDDASIDSEVVERIDETSDVDLNMVELTEHRRIDGAAENINIKIVEIVDQSSEIDVKQDIVKIVNQSSEIDLKQDIAESIKHCIEKAPSETSRHSSNTMISLLDVLDQFSPTTINSQELSPFNPMSPDDLKVTIQSLNIQSCLQEESNEDCSVHNQEIRPKKKMQVSHKSPYESQTFTAEDKRRRRLLEIRESREKRKKRIREKFPQKYSKCAKGHMAPTATSSVTKLSISNKSFYNSIFGQLGNITNNRMQKLRVNNKLKREKDSELYEGSFEKHDSETALAAATNYVSENNTNVGNILSEMEFRIKDGTLNSKRQLDGVTTNILKRVESSIVSSESSNSINLQSVAQSTMEYIKNKDNLIKDNNNVKPHNILHTTKSLHHLKPSNSKASKVTNDVSSTKISVDSKVLDVIEETDRVSEKKYPSRANLECRESIDKIYDLMRKIGKTDNILKPRNPTTKTKFTTSNLESQKATSSRASELSLKDSDSVMNIKQSITSLLSLYSGDKSFNKNTKHKEGKRNNNINIPKVIIKSKFPTKEYTSDTTREKKFEPTKEKKQEPELTKYVKRINHSAFKASSHNPLPTISQVLEEVKNLQRTRRRNSPEVLKKNTNNFIPNLKKSNNKRASRLNQHEMELEEERPAVRKPIRPTVKSQSPSNKKSKMPSKTAGVKMPVDTLERRLPNNKKISSLDEETRVQRVEAARGPPRQPVATSRLDALAQPRKSYVQANSEQLMSKYGRNIISDRLQRLAQAPPATLFAKVEKKGPNQARSRRNSPKDSKNSAKVAENRDYERLSTSTNGSKSTTSIGVEVDPTARTATFKNKYTIDASIEKWNMDPETYIETDYGYISWHTNAKLNPKSTRKPYIPLIPKHSEKGDFEIEASSEESVTYLDEFGNTKLKKETKGFFGNIQAVKLAADGDKARMARIKNGRVTLDPEDLIDSDILNFGKALHIENTTMIKKRPTLEQVNKLDALICLKDIASKIEYSPISRHASLLQLQNPFKISQLSLTSEHPSRSLFVLQAGDASTMVTIQSMQSLTDKITCHIEPSTKMGSTEINDWIHWDKGSIPMQVNTVGYSFPVKCNQDVLYERTGYQRTNAINYSILENSAEDLEQTGITESSPKENMPNEPNNSIDLKEKIIDTGKEINLHQEHESRDESHLDCTSSLDVLVNLLNEIRSISTRQTHIASSFNSCINQKESQVATRKLTTENGTTYDIVTTSSEEDIRKLKPFSGVYSLYVSDEHLVDEEVRKVQDNATSVLSTILEDKCVAVELPQKQLVSQCTETKSQSKLPPMLCKGTSVTSLLTHPLPSTSECTKSTIDLEKKCTDLIPYNTITCDNLPRTVSYQIVSVFKRHSSVQLNVDEEIPQTEKKQNRGIVVEPEHCEEDYDVIKIKRDILLSVYAVLIFAVFAALSYPDILLLKS